MSGKPVGGPGPLSKYSGRASPWRLSQSAASTNVDPTLALVSVGELWEEAGVTEGQADWGDLEAIVADCWNPGGFNDVTG